MRPVQEDQLSDLERRLLVAILLVAIYEQTRRTPTIPVYPAYLALQPEWRDLRIGPLVRQLLTLGYLQQAPNRTLTITPAGIRRIALAPDDRPLP